MKPRCTWTGHLKISLVTVPVRVYTAVSTTEKLAFNQLHKSCHQRIRQKLVCPVHGEVAREDLVKGYEYATDQFVILNESELDAVRLETTGTIDLVQFVRPEELDPVYFDAPYYLGPDGPVAQEGFAVIRGFWISSNPRSLVKSRYWCREARMARSSTLWRRCVKAWHRGTGKQRCGITGARK